MSDERPDASSESGAESLGGYELLLIAFVPLPFQQGEMHRYQLVSFRVNGSGSEPSLAPLVGFRSPGKEINTSWVR